MIKSYKGYRPTYFERRFDPETESTIIRAGNIEYFGVVFMQNPLPDPEDIPEQPQTWLAELAPAWVQDLWNDWVDFRPDWTPKKYL